MQMMPADSLPIPLDGTQGMLAESTAVVGLRLGAMVFRPLERASEIFFPARAFEILMISIIKTRHCPTSLGIRFL
jgi:hypothetical protein